MYACLCNALKESQVQAAGKAGCATPEEAMAFLGARPECRACLHDMACLLAPAREAALAARADGQLHVAAARRAS